MRIFVVGATGVLGRALLPHLRGHDVVGSTRSPEKAEPLRSLCAEVAVCDAYDRERLIRVVTEARPELVVNLLTDLAGGDREANARIRREGGPNVVAAARAAGALRLAVESVAFAVEGASAEAVAALERGALDSGLEAVILRFGRLWGPGTWYAEPPAPPAVHVAEAGRLAAGLVTAAPPGIHVVAET
jgi:nucleoside-diphosphate-sugar epimerase